MPKDESIHLEECSSKWTEKFEKERMLIEYTLNSWILGTSKRKLKIIRK